MRYAILAAVLSLATFTAVRGYETRPEADPACKTSFETADSDDAAVRFVPLHVFIDSGEAPLAAWQFELNATSDVKIVGVENGEHEAFAEPAYYDPAALMNNRIIIAAFSTADALPTGRTRVATIHLQITGDADPDYELILTVAGARDGSEIPATITSLVGEEQ
ncbi:MAG: hypothetical protein IH624_19385 [Phycisphaerae bacterium]|nr:hypothetical protein [Phycisphaerae bacterium]